MSNLNKNVEQLKALTQKVKNELNQRAATAKNLLNVNKKATAEVVKAPTPEAAAPAAELVAQTTTALQNNAMAAQKAAESAGIPISSTPVQTAASAAVAGGNNSAMAANALAAQAAGAAPEAAPTATAVGNATQATNAALGGQPNNAALALNAATRNAVNATKNASPAALKIANTIKKNLMSNARSKAPMANFASRSKVAANVLNTKFNGGYLNSMGGANNFKRAYENLMKNGNLSANQKNVIKRIYFSYMLKPNSGGKRRNNLPANNLTGFANFNSYKASK